jgi:AAA ATPase domain
MPIPVLTEAALAVVAKAVLAHAGTLGARLALPEDRVRRWLGRDPQQLAFQAALASALATFADQHPDWAASLFDQHFLSGPAAPLLARCLTSSGAPEAEDLAAAWADQLGSDQATREEWIAKATPVAAHFLHTLEKELRHREEFRPLYDSLVLDRINESVAQSAEHLQALRNELAQALEQANARYEVAVSQGLGVLIGDHGQQINIFHLYAQASGPLASQIRTSEFETLVEERTRKFVGRDFVFRAIDELLDDTAFASGYIIVRGEPGIGKTALMGELVKRRGYVHHFNIATQNIRSVRDFLSNICAQLIVRYGLPHNQLPPEATQDSGFLSLLLAEAAAKEEGHAIIVLIDALDEAEDTGLAPGANRLFLPRVLPRGVHIIASTREQEDYRLIIDHREDIYLDDKDPQNLADVRQYIRNFIREHQAEMAAQLAKWHVDEEEFIDAMTERSQGNFMYVVYVLQDILKARLTAKNIDNVRKLPQGLREYYRLHWRTMELQGQKRFRHEYKPVVCTLAAAQEPVTVEQLEEWTGLGTSVIRRVITDWREFLNLEEDEAGEFHYRLYHASFQDFLREDVGLKHEHQAIAKTALSKIPGFLTDR